MLKQIKVLTKLQIYNLFSINEFRYTKDKKRKFNIALLGAVWLLLIGYVMAYAGGSSYILCKLDMEQFIPGTLAMSVAFVVLLLTIFKAGALTFSKKSYDLQMPLPVSTTTVVVSRFLAMYVTNLGLSIMVMAPGIVVYGLLEKPGFFFYFYGSLGTLILPLLPQTVATIVGAGIVAISARCKKKNVVEIVLTILFIISIFGGSMFLSGKEEVDIYEVMKNMAPMLESRIRTTYPPAMWVGNAMVYGKHIEMLLFVGSSVLLFAVLIYVLQKNYVKVNSLLHAHESKSTYEMEILQEKSVLRSMWERELRHYFSSSIYVTNTMVGYLMMVILSAAILVLGIEEIEKTVGVSGVVLPILPLILGMMPSTMPTTVSSISIEGKQWWIAQTLPISFKDLICAKILMNLSVVAPFYVLAEVLVCIAIKPTGIQLLWLVLIPALNILWGAVSGILINLKLPVFNWESEVYVVKQSAATFVGMLAGLLSGVIPVAIVIVCKNLNINWFYVIWAIVLLVGTGVCYTASIRTKPEVAG